MNEKFSGKVWVLGDDIDTDIIIPTEYLALKTVEDMKPYAFSPLRPELAGQIKPGDIIVAGKNFGCGSSREQSPEVIKALGIKCVIAKSYARIFFRNSINNLFFSIIYLLVSRFHQYHTMERHILLLHFLIILWIYLMQADLLRQ